MEKKAMPAVISKYLDLLKGGNVGKSVKGLGSAMDEVSTLKKNAPEAELKAMQKLVGGMKDPNQIEGYQGMLDDLARRAQDPNVTGAYQTAIDEAKNQRAAAAMQALKDIGAVGGAYAGTGAAGLGAGYGAYKALGGGSEKSAMEKMSLDMVPGFLKKYIDLLGPGANRRASAVADKAKGALTDAKWYTQRAADKLPVMESKYTDDYLKRNQNIKALEQELKNLEGVGPIKLTGQTDLSQLPDLGDIQAANRKRDLPGQIRGAESAASTANKADVAKLDAQKAKIKSGKKKVERGEKWKKKTEDVKEKTRKASRNVRIGTGVGVGALGLGGGAYALSGGDEKKSSLNPYAFNRGYLEKWEYR